MGSSGLIVLARVVRKRFNGKKITIILVGIIH